MAKKKNHIPILEWVEHGSQASGNLIISERASPIPTNSGPFSAPRVPTLIARLKENLATGGKWSAKSPEWVEHLLLYTIDGLAETIRELSQTITP